MSQKFKFDFVTTITGILLTFGFIFFLNPELHYHTQQVAWLSNSDFLKYHLGFPGGPAEYMTLFLTQFFYSRILGSFIFVGLLILAVFLLRGIADSIAKDLNITPLVVIVNITLVALMCDYRFYFSVILNLIIVLKFLYIEQIWRTNEKQKTFFVLLSGIIIYYISGGAYFLIYMISAAFLSMKTAVKGQLIRMFLLLGFMFLIPFVFYKFVFPVSIEQAYLRATPDVAPMLRYHQTLLFKATLILLPLIMLILVSISRLPLVVNKIRSSKISQFLSIGITVTGFIAIWFFAYKPQEKIKIEIDYNAYFGNWDKVIELTNKVDGYDRMVNYQYNRAISYKEEMLDKLFKYPQLLGTQGLFLDKPFTSEVALACSDLYFDLGNIDESQRFAFEAQTLIHYSPRVISRLTINSIILENYNAAGTFGNIAKTNRNMKHWITQMRPLIENPATAAADPLVSEKRKLLNKPEGVFLTPREKLVSLLERNPGNKKAFDYLIAFDLMEHDLVSFSKHMDYFPKAGYNKLPVVIEEAVILFLSQRPENEFLKSFNLSANTRERFNNFAKLLQSAKGDKQKARQATEAFKETYWYYVLFSSPLVTKVKVETRPSEANY